MGLGQQLKEKQKEIESIVLRHRALKYTHYQGRGVRIFGCPYEASEIPAVEILMNFDRPDADKIELIICFRKPTLPLDPSYTRNMGPLDLLLELESLLGCNANVVDQRGLQSYYPTTYSQTLETNAWDF